MRFGGCCARAGRGIAAVAAPPRSVINSRRFMAPIRDLISKDRVTPSLNIETVSRQKASVCDLLYLWRVAEIQDNLTGPMDASACPVWVNRADFAMSSGRPP